MRQPDASGRPLSLLLISLCHSQQSHDIIHKAANFIRSVSDSLLYSCPNMDDVASFITNIPVDAYGTCLCIASKKVITDIQETYQSSTSAIDDDGEDELNIPVTTNNEDAVSRTTGCWNNQYKWNGDDIPTTLTPKDIADHQNVDNGIVCVNSFQVYSHCLVCTNMMPPQKYAFLAEFNTRIVAAMDFVNDKNKKRPKPARLLCSTASDTLICTLLQKIRSEFSRLRRQFTCFKPYLHLNVRV